MILTNYNAALSDMSSWNYKNWNNQFSKPPL